MGMALRGKGVDVARDGSRDPAGSAHVSLGMGEEIPRHLCASLSDAPALRRNGGTPTVGWSDAWCGMAMRIPRLQARIPQDALAHCRG